VKIVVGFDGSDNARRALERASRLAAGDAVLVVSVVPLSAPGARGPAAVEAPQIEAHHEQLAEARKVLASHGADAQLIETLGNPIGDVADALMHVARDHEAELIVVGIRGLGRRKSLLVGSVSAKLVREASCDILVVR
jgi:nucleotide-binding universal stress UspA family protein